MNNEGHGNDLQKIIAQGFDELKHIHGESFDPQKVNLAELERITGLSRSRLRTLKNEYSGLHDTSVRCFGNHCSGKSGTTILVAGNQNSGMLETIYDTLELGYAPE